jgi:hypothetical protein
MMWRLAHLSWLKMLNSLPDGSRTKNRRTPQGSSAGPYSIGIFAFFIRASAASRSSTSIDTSGIGAPVSPMSAAALPAGTEQLAFVAALGQRSDNARAARLGMPSVLFEHKSQLLPDEF